MGIRKANDPNRNITRLDASTRGYEVRVMRRGKLHCKLFSASLFGGKRKALTAAREYRDELVEKLASKAYTRKQLAKRVTSRNTSGIVGVRFVQESDSRSADGVVYEYWEAQWSPSPGVRSKKRFSVKVHGPRNAKKLAIKAREAGVRKMEK